MRNRFLTLFAFIIVGVSLNVRGTYYYASGGGATFTYNATETNKSGVGTSYIERATLLTGASDSALFFYSGFHKFYGADGTQQWLFEFGDQTISNPIRCYRDASNKINIIFYTAVNGLIGGSAASTAVVQATGWFHLLIEVDLSIPRYRIYVNDVDDNVGGANDFGGTGTIPYATFATGKWVLGATSDGSTSTGEVGWCEPLFDNIALDITNATNRRNFITPGLKPADPTTYGSSAYWYFRNAAASFNTNSGNGGTFTTIGTLTDLLTDKP